MPAMRTTPRDILVHKVEAHDVVDAHSLELQHDRRQVAPHYLGRRHVDEAVEPVLRVQPACKPQGNTHGALACYWSTFLDTPFPNKNVSGFKLMNTADKYLEIMLEQALSWWE
jgi:hypothetical protein